MLLCACYVWFCSYNLTRCQITIQVLKNTMLKYRKTIVSSDFIVTPYKVLLDLNIILDMW